MENNRKRHLIDSLNLAIKALDNDTIRYDWTTQSSCNCGVVSQAVLRKSASEIRNEFLPVIEQINAKNDYNKKYNRENYKEINRTWKNGVKYFCDITGKSSFDIYNDLQDAGLTVDDIVHLEYLENPAILKNSGIQTKEKIITYKVQRPIKSLIGRLFNLTEVVTLKNINPRELDNDVIILDKIEKQINTCYWQEKRNLILYLKSWVQILTDNENESTKYSDVEQLEKELLLAIADEDYEKAAKLRDKISTN